MIPKLPNAKDKHLVIVEFLGDNELLTGKGLATIINQDCPFIGHVHYFHGSDSKSIESFITSNMANYFEENADVAIYFDSHGTENSDGLATKQGAFLAWVTLLDCLKIGCTKLRKKPMLILAACNGLGIKNRIEQLDTPIVAKLIAGNGVILNGAVLEAFHCIIMEKGIDINTQDLGKINHILHQRYNGHPDFEYIEF